MISTVLRKLSFIRAAEKVLECWRIEPDLFFHGTEIPLNELAEIGTGSTPSRTVPDYFNGNVNWVLTTEIDERDINETKETLTERAIRDYGLRIYPEGTILLAMYGQGQTRGRTAFLVKPAAVTQNCAAIVVDQSRALPRYVYQFLQSQYEVIRGQDYMGAGVPHLNLKIVGSIRIPLPPMSDQQEMVAAIEKDKAAFQRLQQTVEKYHSEINRLAEDIWMH